MSEGLEELAPGSLASALRDVVSGPIHINTALDMISRWRIGGRAAAVVEPSSPSEAAAVLRIMRERPEPIVIIGETSNVLFDSRPFDGVLMRIGSRMSRWSIEENRVLAEAGASVPALVRACAEAGLGGIIHAAGVPGTLGGLVMMNGGTKRKGIGDHVVGALISDNHGELQRIGHSDLGFAYRTSSLQNRTAAILEVELELERGDSASLVAEIDAVLAERSHKFPQELPNCGSTFLSDPAMYSVVGPPGRVIEEAGLKQVRRGGAMISEQHANFIINLGGATDDDVLWLIALVRSTVRARTGFTLECEVRHLSPDGRLRPAHEVADERWPDVPPQKG